MRARKEWIYYGSIGKRFGSDSCGAPVTCYESSRLVCVGCIEGGATYIGDTSNRGDINMGNCVIFLRARHCMQQLTDLSDL